MIGVSISDRGTLTWNNLKLVNYYNNITKTVILKTYRLMRVQLKNGLSNSASRDSCLILESAISGF